MTDTMLLAAARALGSWQPNTLDAPLLPPIEQMQEAAIPIAVAVGRQAILDGVAPARDVREVESLIRKRLWRPAYPELIAESVDCHDR